jgi:membrane protease YdiL (CAAX protease family)
MSDGSQQIHVDRVAVHDGRPKPVAPAWHTVLFLVVFVGLSIAPLLLHLPQQPEIAVNRIKTYLSTMAYQLGLLAYVWFLGLMLYKVPLREIIGGKWRRWKDFWLDVGLALLFWLAVIGLLLAARILLGFDGAAAAKSIYPSSLTETCIFVALAVLAGFCEEVIFRGYLLRQFTAWTGNVSAGVVLQAIVFGSGHLYQSWKGAVVISVYGSFFGILAVMRKSLRPGMIQHCAQDGFSGVLVYIAQKRHMLLPLIRF